MNNDAFKQNIQQYLEVRAMTDELFREKYQATNRNIDDICNYIFNTVYESNRIGFEDDEIYDMAVHCIDEPDLIIKQSPSCRVLHNRRQEYIPTQQEIALQKQIALNRIQNEEYARLKKLKTKNNNTAQSETQPSLFD